MRYNFDLSYGNSKISTPFHINYEGGYHESYDERIFSVPGTLVCDIGGKVEDVLIEMIDRASGIDRDTLLRVDGVLIDKDVYSYAKKLLNKFSNLDKELSRSFADLDWQDFDCKLGKSYFKDDEFGVNFDVYVRRVEGKPYFKSGEYEDSQSYRPIDFNMYVEQEYDSYERVHLSEIHASLAFPYEPDESEKEEILSYSVDELYRFAVDTLTNFIKKHITIYKKSSAKTRIKNSDLLDMAENIWVFVTDEDFQHELSQEELIQDTLDRLERNLDQQLTSNQKTTVTRFLKKFGEFKYKGPNGLHYDTDQPWL